MDRDQARLEISKEMFVQALETIPNRPPKRNRPLMDLVSHYRNELEHCEDEFVVPYRLRRFFPDTMTFSDFIYEVTWGPSR